MENITWSNKKRLADVCRVRVRVHRWAILRTAAQGKSVYGLGSSVSPSVCECSVAVTAVFHIYYYSIHRRLLLVLGRSNNSFSIRVCFFYISASSTSASTSCCCFVAASWRPVSLSSFFIHHPLPCRVLFHFRTRVRYSREEPVVS
jgi:hypothetical protein